jgi:hypothetical protein
MVSEAAAAAGIARSTAYRYRSSHPDFEEAWGGVEERVTEELEQEAVRRAKDGSDVLLIFLLKARRPNMYRERIPLDDREAARRRELARLDDEELDRQLTGLDDNVTPIARGRSGDA